MKKILLSLSVVLCTTFFANAQCTPDPNISGLYKAPAGSKNATKIIGNDTITYVVLPYAYVGQSYNEVIYFKIPVDTPAYGQIITINFAKLDSVYNMPSGFSTNCNPAGCKFFGGSSGCLTLSGTPQVADSVELKIAVTYNINFNGNTPLYDTIGGFYFVTKGQAVGLEEKAINKSVPKLYPNPASSSLNIEYQSEATNPVEVTLTNILGRAVAIKSFDSTHGSNTFTFDVQSLSPGVYLYSVRENQKTFTGRFTISR